MARTYKDNPSYLKGKKRKEKKSEKYLRYKNGEDDFWDSHLDTTNREPYYKCIERKMPVFYDDSFTEGLIDQLDNNTDFENDKT